MSVNRDLPGGMVVQVRRLLETEAIVIATPCMDKRRLG
jgi:hypothetical protein